MRQNLGTCRYWGAKVRQNLGTRTGPRLRSGPRIRRLVGEPSDRVGRVTESVSCHAIWHRISNAVVVVRRAAQRRADDAAETGETGFSTARGAPIACRMLFAIACPCQLRFTGHGQREESWSGQEAGSQEHAMSMSAHDEHVEHAMSMPAHARHAEHAMSMPAHARHARHIMSMSDMLGMS